MWLAALHLVAGQQHEDPLGVGCEGGQDVADGGQLEAAAGPHHHALAARLLCVGQEGCAVKPDEVEPCTKNIVL